MRDGAIHYKLYLLKLTMAVDNFVFRKIKGALYVFLYNTIKLYCYGRLVNWLCQRLHAQSTRGRTTTIQAKSERWRHRLARHKCTIHNSRDAVTVSLSVATRSRADCSSMEGHTSLSISIALSLIRFRSLLP